MRIISIVTLLIMFSIGFTPAGGGSAYAMQSELALTSPAAFQVFQRHGGLADIPITGQVNAEGMIEARFNGGEWQRIAAIRSGAFSGVLAGQAQGQGALEVRVVEAPELTFAVPNVGIGDVFIVAGQSNASGRGYNPQAVSHQWLKGSVFGNDYVWRELSDPFDTTSNQADPVSIDLEAGGSVWTLVGAHLMNERNIPVAFVPAARGGSSIDDWLPGRNHFDRGTLYGSMATRARLSGAKAVLWWQGETDALNGMSQADYQAQFSQLVDAIQRDLGIPVMPCLIHNSMGIADDGEAAVRRAVVEGARANSAIVLGPDLSDLASDDQYHLQSDANLQTAAERWWAALQGVVE